MYVRNKSKYLWSFKQTLKELSASHLRNFCNLPQKSVKIFKIWKIIITLNYNCFNAFYNFFLIWSILDVKSMYLKKFE